MRHKTNFFLKAYLIVLKWANQIFQKIFKNNLILSNSSSLSCFGVGKKEKSASHKWIQK